MSYSKRVWVCPYYRCDYPDKLSCEAGKITMHDRETLRQYAVRYCASYGWEECTLAKILCKTEEMQNARKQQGQGETAGKGAARS